MNDEIKATMNCGKDNSNVDGLDNGSNPSNIGGPGNGNGPGNKNTKLDVKITKDAIIRGATEEYIKKIDPHNVPAPNEIAHDLNLATRGEFVVRNIGAAKNDQWRLPSTLYALQIAMIISAFEKVICIIVNEMERCPELEPIAVYMDSGEMEGLYDISDLSIKKVIHKYDCMADEKKVREIIAFLREMLPHKLRTMDPNLVAVNNGIFNTQTKQLMAFSPDYIFLTKSKVNYVDNALNPNIKDANGRIWDVETWIHELFDDPELETLIWEILSAIVRPFACWDKLVLFYSTVGCNGKGTLCHLMRNLCGPGSVANISLTQFGEQFGVEPLMSALAVVVDENDVGRYIGKCSNLKAAVTHDVVAINRKNRPVIKFRFFGLIVQCVNQLDKFRDKTDTLYRRFLIVPFSKSFKNVENKAIKDDYLNRKEVLEYVLCRVLNMTHTQLSEPKACKEALGDFEESNDTFLQFMNEVLPEFVWDLLPFGFLYDLYCAWMRRNARSSEVMNKNRFIDRVIGYIENNTEWECPGRKHSIRSTNKMGWPEPLIAEYDLRNWNDFILTQLAVIPKLKSTYCGLQRRTPRGNPKAMLSCFPYPHNGH